MICLGAASATKSKPKTTKSNNNGSKKQTQPQKNNVGHQNQNINTIHDAFSLQKQQESQSRRGIVIEVDGDSDDEGEDNQNTNNNHNHNHNTAIDTSVTNNKFLVLPFDDEDDLKESLIRRSGLSSSILQQSSAIHAIKTLPVTSSSSSNGVGKVSANSNNGSDHTAALSSITSVIPSAVVHTSLFPLHSSSASSQPSKRTGPFLQLNDDDDSDEGQSTLITPPLS